MPKFAPQQVRRRKQCTINYEASSKVAGALGRGMIYREIYLKLSGAPTLAGANNTQAKTLRGDEWAVVTRIDVIANNTEVIRSMSGNELWWANYFLYGVPPHVTPAIGDGATANVPFATVLVMPFWMPRSIRPMDTALDARKLSDLKVEITWGTYASMNADASAWTTEPKIEIWSLESFGVDMPFSQFRMFTIEKEITATNSQFQVSLPVGPMYRGFILNTTDAGKDDGDVINNFKIVSGSTVFADIIEEVLDQVDGWQRNSTARFWDGAAGAAAVYDPPRRGTTYNLMEGWYFYDHVTDGYLTESIDTLGFSEFNLELDVTVGGGTTKLYVIPLQVVPVRKPIIQKAA